MTPDQAKPGFKKKESSNFRDFVELNKELTIEQAIEVLKLFHKNSTEKAILNAFPNLNNLKQEGKGKVVFENSLSNGAHCLGITCFNEDGTWKSHSLIDEDTGQPIQHTS